MPHITKPYFDMLDPDFCNFLENFIGHFNFFSESL